MKAKPGTASSPAEPILEFSSAEDWFEWLKRNHRRSQGVLLRLGKKGVKKSLAYPQALEAALSWGWIDSQKRALDATAWLQRFTPRKPNSPWSKINRAKAQAQIDAGQMQAPGLAEVDRAKRDGRWERAYDGAKSSGVPPDLAAALARKPRARAFFEQLDSANRYAILYRVQTAKTPETRAERIERFMAMCAAGETIHPPRKAKSTVRPRKTSRTAG